MNRRLFCLLLTAAAAPLLACGGGDAPAKQPSAPYEAEPRSIEEAEAQIARAKAELQSGGEKDERPRAVPSDGAPKVEPSPPPPPPPAPPSPHEPSVREEPRGGGPQSSCASPCRALASMRRAVDALCRMTGDTDARCTGARHTLDESAARVSACGC